MCCKCLLFRGNWEQPYSEATCLVSKEMVIKCSDVAKREDGPQAKSRWKGKSTSHTKRYWEETQITRGA